MPGILVSIVCDTLMSPFSMSSPHSAIAPSDETKPSCGITQSIGSVSSCFVLLLMMVTRSMRSAPLIHVLEWQFARREGADPTGDQDGAARIFILVGDDREQRLAILLCALEADHLLRKMHRRLPLQSLLRHPLHQVFGENLREAGNVEDVFLGVERGQLAADLIQVIDQPVGRATHAGIKRREQTRRAGADDGDIFRVLHRANANLLLVLVLVGCAGNGRPAALGWSLGGEAHVFIAGDRLARDLYHQLTGNGGGGGGGLAGPLRLTTLITLGSHRRRKPTGHLASGAGPARLVRAPF